MMEKITVSSNSGVGETGPLSYSVHGSKLKADYKDLNVRPKAVKILEDIETYLLVQYI